MFPDVTADLIGFRLSYLIMKTKIKPSFMAVGAACLAAALCSPLVSPAAPVTFASTARQTSLLELYTSEGCSSCPPAEAWLSGLKDNPGLWRDFVPVAFHVDYWNYLGWRDKWSRA